MKQAMKAQGKIGISIFRLNTMILFLSLESRMNLTAYRRTCQQDSIGAVGLAGISRLQARNGYWPDTCVQFRTVAENRRQIVPNNPIATWSALPLRVGTGRQPHLKASPVIRRRADLIRGTAEIGAGLPAYPPIIRAALSVLMAAQAAP